MTASLLGLCVCGHPVFRHRRLDGRQITCAQLREMDQALFQSGARASQPVPMEHDSAHLPSDVHGGEV